MLLKQGDVWKFPRPFLLWAGGVCAGGIQYVEAKDTAEHPRLHRRAPHYSPFSNPNVGSAEAETPRPTGQRVSDRSGTDPVHKVPSAAATPK